MADEITEGNGYHQAPPWKTYPRWECDRCPYDSLDEDDIVDHVAKLHVGEPARTSMILGPDGRHIAVPAESPEALFENTVALHTLDAGDLKGLTRDQLTTLAERRGIELPAKTRPTIETLTEALTARPTTEES